VGDARDPFIATYADPRTNLQQTVDAAVVMPTIMRPEIEQALRSVFEQDYSARVQVLVGIGRLVTDLTPIHDACSHLTVSGKFYTPDEPGA